MTYGYKWIEEESRFVVGSQTEKLFMRQSSEFQPVGHWVKAGEREFRDGGIWDSPWLLERLIRRIQGWKWKKYPDPRWKVWFE